MEDNNFGVALVKRVCPVCTKEYDGEIVLNSVLTQHNKKAVEELHGKVIGYLDKPCDECKETYYKNPNTIIFIECDKDKTEDEDNPYRTGNIMGIKKEAFKKDGEIHPVIEKNDYIFISIEELKELLGNDLYNQKFINKT